MEYIINGNIKYNSSDGTLFCPDNSLDMITLTRVTSELLLLLIKNNGVPLSRDTILSEIWEKRGLSASSNNLNNYVSMLRKALAQCGCPDLITTIPKHGFLFEAEIVAIGQHAQLPEEQNKKKVTQNGALEFEISTHRKIYLSSLFNRKLMAIIIVFSLLVIFLSPSLYNHFRSQSLRTELFSLDNCRFYLMDDTTRRMDSGNTISIIKMIIKNEKLQCDSPANVYYFADKKIDSAGQTIETDLLSYCPYDSKAPCENYYLSKHESKDENEN
ncbi:winged helix-turn-helix domain-containing protein [Yersinia kristensenii]|uniref:winged helix-turn-helix domain-containing protein n=1 Tax=Yersinia kristensenii TaxID=28152 RepID=UPI0005E884DD|nr:helix-turn-helix domain-containing protein [Yersinia kristensenii]CNE49208.1 membrane protein [Yersinia kristensenii]CNG89689.1 membrane protein [Yersinia kristensenii]CNK25183.1 membrane protein [Yersinia kristensenii]